MASELIEQLNRLIAEYGDLRITVKDHAEGNDWPMGQVRFQGGFFTNESGEKVKAVAAYYIE